MRGSNDEDGGESDDADDHEEDTRLAGSVDCDKSFNFGSCAHGLQASCSCMLDIHVCLGATADDLVEEKEAPDEVEDKKDAARQAVFSPELDTSPLQKPRKDSAKSRVSNLSDSLEFSMSPLRSHRTEKANDRRESRGVAPHDLSFSSSRRLASLLESTDWSQLESSSASLLSTEPRSKQQSAGAKRQSGGYKPRQPRRSIEEATKDGSAASIELVYDPVLNCYYDPVANKYYALASE